MSDKIKTGYLEVLVLFELETSSRTGYELMDILGEKIGRKPSPGSIYPLLSKMTKDNLINYKINGNKKYYFLSAQGKKLLKLKLKQKENMISKHLDLLKSMMKSHMCKRNPEIDSMNRLNVSRKVSNESAELLLLLKETILEAVLDEKYLINEKAFNDSIKRSIIEIEKLSNKKNSNSKVKLSKVKVINVKKNSMINKKLIKNK